MKSPLFLLVAGLLLGACGSDGPEDGSPVEDGATADTTADNGTSPDGTTEDADAPASTGPADGGDTTSTTEDGVDSALAPCAGDECDIDGECWSNGTISPHNPCIACLVIVDASAWSAADETECDDGSACTTGDACVDGACIGLPTVCDDGNPCTDDACDEPSGACQSTANAAPCDDGDACTSGSACAGGACQKGAGTLACDDGQACTIDTCDPAIGCVFAPASEGPCDDGDECTGGDHCTTGGCYGEPVGCTDFNVCTVDFCQPGLGCVSKSIQENCDDGNPCTDDGCDAVLGCVYPFNAVTCDDGSACTELDTCSAGACAGVGIDIDDGNPCTSDTCDPASGAVHTPNTLPCDDGNVCTVGDGCVSAACIPGPDLLACDDDNPCTDDGCVAFEGCTFAPNTLGCDDGSVCTVDDVCGAGGCAGTVVPCDDGNVCTADVCDPIDGCGTTVIVSKACRPNFVGITPPRGATLTGSPDSPNVTVSGKVTSAAGAITALSINDVPVTVGEDGSFSVDVPAQVGGNTLVFDAMDELGTSKNRVQAFLWSVGYLKPIKAQPKSGMVDPGLGIWLAQEVIDDGDHSLPPNDLATIMALAADSLNLAGLIPSPAFENGQYKVFVKNLTHSDPSLSLSSQPGGLGINIVIANVKADVHADGKKLFCIPNPFGSDECVYAPDFNGTLTISSIVIDADIALSVQNHEIVAKVSKADVTINGADISIDSAVSFIINPILDLVVDAFKDDLEKQFEGEIAGAIEPALQTALASLAIGATFDMPSLGPGGESVPVELITDFHSVAFEDAGGAILLRAGFYADQKTPYVNDGVPTRAGCLAGPQVLAIPKAHPFELVLADDTLNELLFAAWTGGLLEFVAPPDLIGGEDLEAYGITDMTLQVSGMLAPTLSDCNEDGELLVHIGDLKVTAKLSFLTQPMDVEMWVSFTAGVEFAASDDELTFQLTEVKAIHQEVNVLQDALVGSEAAIAGLIQENLVPALLAGLGGDALGGFPLPAIDLSETVDGVPDGTEIAISPTGVFRDQGNTIVGGTLK